MKFSYYTLTLLFSSFLIFIFFSSATNVHFNEWTAVKIFPSIALWHCYDLYQTSSSPYLLTVYGPGSPFFYLLSAMGSSPISVFFIASAISSTALFSIALMLFYKSPIKPVSIIYACFGFTWLFLLFLDKTTHSLFQIHHDLPVILYFALGSFLLLKESTTLNLVKLIIAFLFFWMTFWTKIVALPWVFLPFIAKILFSNHSCSPLSTSWNRFIFTFMGSGCFLFLAFGFLFGFGDIFFHLFQSTNSYSFRECLTLFGATNENLVSNDFLSKIYALFRISILYTNEYWILLITNCFIFLHQLKSRDNFLLVWLSMSYFWILPFCLAALAKFGGVENSLVFAHTPAYAALLLQGVRLLHALNFSNWFKVFIAVFITLAPALGSIRTAKAILRNPAQSPQQIAYEYLVKNPNTPIFFALAPLPNYLATGKVWDSGEALTYSTMMSPNALPANAGIQGPLEMPYIAFGHPPYSKTFFSKKFDLVYDNEAPKLNGWIIYRSVIKNDI